MEGLQLLYRRCDEEAAIAVICCMRTAGPLFCRAFASTGLCQPVVSFPSVCWLELSAGSRRSSTAGRPPQRCSCWMSC